ncbi:MAG: VOC family protein [Pyrinomonadaceae bacterium]
MGTHFAPSLVIPNAVMDLSFYEEAFGAVNTFTVRNDDRSIHVAEFHIDGAIFHVHEISQPDHMRAPDGKVTAMIGLYVDDVQAVVDRAVGAGATLMAPVTDHEYGYRQAMVEDPFGHRWQIQKVFDETLRSAFIESHQG